MTLRNLLARAAVLAAVAASPSISPAAAVEPLDFGGTVRVDAARVITTVSVPQTQVPEYVARVFRYDVYGTCWSRRGKALPEHEQRIGGGRVPSSSGAYQLRIPPSSQTSFTFETSVQSLLEPAMRAPLRPFTCPAGTTAGAYRLHLRDLDVYASSFGTQAVDGTAVDHYVQAPRTVVARGRR